VLDMPRYGRWAIEVKRGLAPKVEKGFHLACDDLKPKRRLVVYSGDDRYGLNADVEAIGLRELARELAALS
jgi:hypothetical protein